MTNTLSPNEILFRGALTTLYKAQHWVDGEIQTNLVVKAFSISSHNNVLQQYENEVNSLPACAHPNIIPLLGKGHTNKRVFLVLPWLQGSVFDQLDALTWPATLGILRGSARAMQHVHNLGLVIRDFKSQNILLDEASNPILCDFGTVADGYTIVLGATPYYAEPDVVVLGRRSRETDIYSFGVLILQLLSKQKVMAAEPLADFYRGSYDTLTKQLMLQRNPILKDFGCKIPSHLKLLRLGLKCTGPVAKRPPMDKIMHKLSTLN